MKIPKIKYLKNLPAVNKKYIKKHVHFKIFKKLSMAYEYPELS